MVTKHEGFVFHEPSEKAKQIVTRDHKTLSPSYTRSYGFVMDHGKGAEVWDVDGSRYVDFAAGIAVLATGHSHPRVVDAITKQAQQYVHIGATDFFCPQQVGLAERLQQIVPVHRAAPEDKMVYFCNSGTESIEAALKLARYQPGNRRHVIAFFGGFHGRTMGALSVTSSKATQRAEYPYIPGGVDHISYPSKFAAENKDNEAPHYDPIRYIEYFIIRTKVPADEIAAVIVEPIQGEGGYLLPRDDFLPALREFCDKHGILMIADEVQSGVGRTGKWYAMEHWGVSADIVCTAKGLGSGFPIGAIVTHRDVMSAWTPGAHASTFGGNPVACAAANATIDIIEDENLLEHAEKLGERTLARLHKFQQDHTSVRRVEGKGLMIGVEFTDRTGKPLKKFRDEVVNRAYLNGLIALACGTSTLRIAPPLVITQALMDEGLDILEHIIAQLEEEMWEPEAQVGD
jgi:4-aminobutyrate aminotransferase